MGKNTTAAEVRIWEHTTQEVRLEYASQHPTVGTEAEVCIC